MYLSKIFGPVQLNLLKIFYCKASSPTKLFQFQLWAQLFFQKQIYYFTFLFVKKFNVYKIFIIYSNFIIYKVKRWTLGSTYSSSIDLNFELSPIDWISTFFKNNLNLIQNCIKNKKKIIIFNNRIKWVIHSCFISILNYFFKL